MSSSPLPTTSLSATAFPGTFSLRSEDLFFIATIALVGTYVGALHCTRTRQHLQDVLTTPPQKEQYARICCKRRRDFLVGLLLGIVFAILSWNRAPHQTSRAFFFLLATPLVYYLVVTASTKDYLLTRLTHISQAKAWIETYHCYRESSVRWTLGFLVIGYLLVILPRVLLARRDYVQQRSSLGHRTQVVRLVPRIRKAAAPAKQKNSKTQPQ